MSVRLCLLTAASLTLLACGSDDSPAQDPTGPAESTGEVGTTGPQAPESTSTTTGGETGVDSSSTSSIGPDPATGSTSGGREASTGEAGESSSSGGEQNQCFPWRRTLPDSPDSPNLLQSVVVDRADGTIYTGGAYRGELGDLGNASYTDGFVAKFSPIGNLQWLHRVTAQLFEEVEDMVLSPDGTLVIQGTISDATDRDTLLRGIDSDATELWEFESSARSATLYGTSNGVGLCPDGTLRIARNRTIEDGPGANTVAGVLAYDTEGTLLWSTEVGTRTNARLVGCAPSGATYLAATADVDFEDITVEGRDVLLARLDPDGNHEWARVYSSPGTDVPNAMAIGSGDDVFLANSVPGGEIFEGAATPENQSHALLRVDAAGDVLAVAPFGSEGFERVTDISLSPAEQLIAVSGQTNSVDLGDGEYESSWAVELLSPSAESLGLLEDPDPTSNSSAFAVAFADEHSVIVAGGTSVESGSFILGVNSNDPVRSLLLKACIDLE